MTTPTEKLVILGSGPAGLTAAIYAARAGLEPLIIEGQEPGGQLMSTTHVENWPGHISILGPTLMMHMRQHAAHFGTRFTGDRITQVEVSQAPFRLTTHKNTVITARALIIATGATPKKLGCPGEQTYWGNGVTTCAVCDGAFYRDMAVIIVGGGDTAMENALFMTNFTHDITLIHILPHLTASKAMQDKVLSNKHIKIIYNSTVTQIIGTPEHPTHAVVTQQQTGAISQVPARAVFVAIGLTPNTNLFKNQLDLTAYGYLITHEHTQTSVTGVFAAGDVADSRYRQAITSAGSGCMAALDAERYLQAQER